MERSRAFMECPEHGNGRMGADDASGKIVCARCGTEAVEVQYVRADLYRGAVEQLEHARRMAESPGRDPANVLRDVRGALGLDRNTPDPCGGGSDAA